MSYTMNPVYHPAPKQRTGRTGNCYSICPWGTNSYQATCIDDNECLEKKFYLFNGSCVPTCPFGFAGFTDYFCKDVMSDYYAIIGVSVILLIALMGLFCMMYNSKESRLMSAPAKLQGEQLTCVTSDNDPGQQQDNAEHPYEGNMEFNSDEEMLHWKITEITLMMWTSVMELRTVLIM
ncbi:uncharacterized protein LOC124291491 [Haliotis rubra]|uniref:uncharacterized protein LOC124291491 n=1 Tax=Haliotis rubra TaxID=36100 RepID=UPI001EE5F79E|nr:uncharacterized protein LOC124291491 [Haliotis rubra]